VLAYYLFYVNKDLMASNNRICTRCSIASNDVFDSIYAGYCHTFFRRFFAVFRHAWCYWPCAHARPIHWSCGKV